MDAEIESAYALASRKFDIELQLLLEAIYHLYHYDFRDYAQASLRRRLKGALGAFQMRDALAAAGSRAARAGVFRALLDYLTVQVSEMFRDPSYFRALREQVVPLLRTYPSLKVWVAGCSPARRRTRWPSCCAKRVCCRRR